MKNLTILLIALALVSCKGDEGSNGSSPEVGTSFTVSGAAQKGPYQDGTTVTIQGLDSNFTVIAGENASTTIQGGLGEFSSALTLPQSTYGDLQACGFFWDELTATTTQERFCSSSILIPNNGPYNLNVVTSIIKYRVQNLLTNAAAGYTGQDALNQASVEFIKEVLGFDQVDYPSSFTLSANNWKITDESPLLLISSLMLGGTIQELESRVASIATDFTDGTLTQANKDFFIQKALAVNPKTIEANVGGKFSLVSDMIRWLTKLDPSRLVGVLQTQGRGTASNYTMISGSMFLGIPFKSGANGLTLDYVAMPCTSSVAEVWSYDGTLTPATKLHTGTTGTNLLPPRSYSDGATDYAISQHQAQFSSVSLPANTNYWLVVNYGSCPFQLYEASPHSKVVRSNDGGATYTIDFFGWLGTPRFTFLN